MAPVSRLISVSNYCNVVCGVMSVSRAMAWGWPSLLEIVSAYHGEIAIQQSELGGACLSVTLKTR